MITNHYGHIVDSEKPVTGVLSIHDIDFSWINDEICLTCEEILESMSEEELEEESDYVECDSSHTRIFGDWLQSEGKYYPDPNGEYAAIENETTVQVVFSKHTARGALCSPCYPGQVDLDSKGLYLAYTLPADLLAE